MGFLKLIVPFFFVCIELSWVGFSRVGGWKGGATMGGRPKGWGGPKFRAFFPLSRRKIRSFLPSLGVFSWNFGGV